MADDLTKTQKAKIKKGLDKIVQTRTSQMADRLTENSYHAYSAGDKAAQKTMGVHLTVKIVQKEATQYMREYGALIKKEGNIMIPVYKKMGDGAEELVDYTKYNLMGHSATQDKKKIFDIIQKEYKKGTPTGLKQTKKGTYPKDSLAKQLEKHFGMQKSHAALVARTEAQRITDQGQRIRYQKLGVTRARWKTSGDDRVRDQHTIRQEHGIYEMDKIPSLGEPNCRCSIVPVLDTENPLPPETKTITPKKTSKTSKSLLTPKKIPPDEASILARTGGGTRYTPEQMVEKMKSFRQGKEGRKVLEIEDELREVNSAIDNLSNYCDTFEYPFTESEQKYIDRITNFLIKREDLEIELRNAKEALNISSRKLLFNEVPNTDFSIACHDGVALSRKRGDIGKKLREGEAFLQNVIGPKTINKDNPLSSIYHKTNTGRAYCRGDGIYINNGDSVGTIVHECGHTFEHNMNEGEVGAFWFRKITDHLSSRTKGERFKKLSDITGNRLYRADEVAKTDEFYRAYMGKYYGTTWHESDFMKDGDFEGARATEFLSIGLESMYTDPVAFAIKDPESFKLVFALIKGL